MYMNLYLDEICTIDLHKIHNTTIQNVGGHEGGGNEEFLTSNYKVATTQEVEAPSIVCSLYFRESVNKPNYISLSYNFVFYFEDYLFLFLINTNYIQNMETFNSILVSLVSLAIFQTVRRCRVKGVPIPQWNFFIVRQVLAVRLSSITTIWEGGIIPSYTMLLYPEYGLTMKTISLRNWNIFHPSSPHNEIPLHWRT